MSFAPLPEEITIAGRRYDVIPLPRVVYRGQELDALACHDSRHIFISHSVPPAVRDAALRQACEEASVMLLASGPIESVA